MDQLLTVEQAAERLSCTTAAIRKWIGQRRLPAVKVGRLTRLREQDLERFVRPVSAADGSAGLAL